MHDYKIHKTLRSRSHSLMNTDQGHTFYDFIWKTIQLQDNVFDTSPVLCPLMTLQGEMNVKHS